jgi:hypothetical protein
MAERSARFTPSATPDAPRERPRFLRQHPNDRQFPPRKHRLFFLGLMDLPAAANLAAAQTKRPNILVIFGDDVGLPDISVYSHGIMGIQTPKHRGAHLPRQPAPDTFRGARRR